MDVKNTFLVVESLAQPFAISMEYIEDILCKDQILNNSPPGKGRSILLPDGQLVPLVDLGLLLWHEKTPTKTTNCVVLANVNGTKFGLYVDSAQEMIWNKSISPLSDNLISGIIETQSKTLPMLNMTKLVPD